MLDVNFTNFITIALFTAISVTVVNWTVAKFGFDLDIDHDGDNDADMFNFSITPINKAG